MNGEAPRAILVGPPMSPPVELTRWLRDRATRPYEFRPRAPALHAFASIRRKVPVELPLLLMPEGAVGGLLNSINALDEELAGGLFERAEQRTFAEELCETLFNPAVRTFYHAMLPERRVLASYATRGVPRTDAIFVRTAYPLWRRLMSKGLGLGSFDPSKAASAIDAAFEAVASGLEQSRFLGGAEPDVRDILFAVLASPVILPPNHPAAIPPVNELPSDFRMRVERWREHRAGKLALMVYEQRPEPANWGNVPPDRLTLRQRAAPGLLRLASRWAAARAPRVLKLGKNVFVSRFADVQEVLARDGGFLIAPINGTRIKNVMGPFILGMDASAELQEQRRAAYAALRHADGERAARFVSAESQRLASAAAARFGAIDAVGSYARPIAARAAVLLFGIQGPSETDFARAARAVFHETFLNLSGDKEVERKGREAGDEIALWIESEIARRGPNAQPSDLIGALIAEAQAGRLDHEQIGWITAGMLVGAIDTTATAVANIVTELAAAPALASAMRKDLDHPHRFRGWCWEALRRRPHNPLLLREAAADSLLAGKSVGKGRRVWTLTLAAMQDWRAFPEPRRLRPDRPQDLYLHFGSGLHRCSGRHFNAVHIPLLVAGLLRRGLSGPCDLRFRGPFPDRLVVRLKGGGDA